MVVKRDRIFGGGSAKGGRFILPDMQQKFDVSSRNFTALQWRQKYDIAPLYMYPASIGGSGTDIVVSTLSAGDVVVVRSSAAA